MFRIDETGNKYNRLTVLSYEPDSKKWYCLCACGNKTLVQGTKLRNSCTQSCGCLGKEKLLLRTKHGMWGTPTYWSWAMMLQRCTNSEATGYENYGGRGIQVLDAWGLFEKFFEDMGEAPAGMSIERIDVNGNYCKENCKWETDSNQSYNRRINSNNTTGKTGVDFVERDSMYRARITHQLEEIQLGVYAKFEDAVKAREKAELKYFGYIKE